MRKALPAIDLRLRKRTPTAVHVGLIGLLEARRGGHAAILVPGAAVFIARLVDWRQHFGAELACFVDHSIDHVGCGVFEAGQIAVTCQIKHFVDDEAGVAGGGGVGRHHFIPWVSVVVSAVLVARSAQIEVLNFGNEFGEFLDRGINIVALRLQLGDMRAAFFDRDPALFDPAIVEIIQINHLADFGQTETDILGAHNPGEPRPITLGIDAGQADAGRADQAFVFVKAQRAGGAAEFRGEVGNGELFARMFVGSIKMRSVTARLILGRQNNACQFWIGCVSGSGSHDRDIPYPYVSVKS